MSIKTCFKRPLFFILLLMTGISILMAATGDEELKKGLVINKRISPGESHHYTVNLKKDQFLLLILDQEGIDVSITTFSPSGEQLEEFDSPNGAEGNERGESGEVSGCKVTNGRVRNLNFEKLKQ